MHRGVLQNKKYIKFADANTVEVIALGRLGEGISKKDKRADTYTTKSGETYLVEFPGMTVAQMNAVRGSKAGSYNKTGKIPYTAIVNPHTGEEITSLPGGQSSKSLMEAVLGAKKKLNKQYGASLSRKTLRKVEKAGREIRQYLDISDINKAMRTLSKLEKKTAKEGDALKAKVAGIRKDILDHATKMLDTVEGLIARDELKTASKTLGKLKRALKKTALETRANELDEKLKAKKAAASDE